MTLVIVRNGIVEPVRDQEDRAIRLVQGGSISVDLDADERLQLAVDHVYDRLNLLLEQSP